MGNSGGGGSTSGMTDFPVYMKTFHGIMLGGNEGATDHTLSMCVAEAFNTAVTGFSPFASYVTNDELVEDAFFSDGQVLANHYRIFNLLKTYQDANFTTLLTSYGDNTTAAELMESVSAALDDEIAINVLPKFKSNLRGIGAVNSSAYVVGEALIWDSKIKAIAKERLNIEQIKNQNQETALKLTLAYIDFKKGIAQTSLDFTKYYYALKTDIQDHYIANDVKDKKWDLDMFQYVNNTLSSISGAALSQGTSDKNPSKVASAIGGALSGAAAGAMVGAQIGAVGGPMGAGIGAALGMAGGLF